MNSPAPTATGLGPWLAYPVVMLLGIWLYHLVRAVGQSPLVSSYAAVAAGAVLVMLLEVFQPHRRSWQAKRNDVRVDGIYMVGVQMLLPIGLALTLSAFVQRQLQALGLEPASLWPHAWPVGVQVILMLLLADFLRYWLHVASHRYRPLWRLHAVHHSPPKLYWLNVGRFHPLEKALQYLLDALPFVLLGVSENVLSLYLVFYGLNGFFQHANIELRFGWLNYLISSAELHRWHHSRLPEESNANYGNNLIVWDILFGTRFLPPDRDVETLGLLNAHYPTQFADQLKAPLIADLDHQPAAVLSWREIGINLLIAARMGWLHVTIWQRFVAAAHQPKQTQLALLKRLLAKNRETRFGREHGFSNITSMADYQTRVPVQTYASLRPYIQEQERTGVPALNAEPPVFYVQTSGTTGDPKVIPVLKSTRDQKKVSQNLFAYALYRAVPAAYAGRILGIASPTVEGRLETGTPFGSASGRIYQNTPTIARLKYIIPSQVFAITDYDTKYLLIVRLALVHKNCTSFASANPSTFLKLLETLQAHRETLLADIESNTFCRLEALPKAVRDVVGPRLTCSDERRFELRVLLKKDPPTIADLWPYLRLIVTWTGGNCGLALDRVLAHCPPHTQVADFGYLSSEFRGSFTIDPSSSGCVPTVTENVFEFVEKTNWEQQQTQFVTLDQLEQGREYYVFITTSAGLYRYFMNDIVRVTGHFFATPTIAFVQKGKGVTSITGEKLYESQVIQAVKQAETSLAFAAHFFMMLADVRDARYRLMIEPNEDHRVDTDSLAATIEQNLRTINVEYAQKRASGRLNPLQVAVLEPGTAEAYKRWCIAQGQREGQFKTLVLQYLGDVPFDYNDRVRHRSQ